METTDRDKEEEKGKGVIKQKRRKSEGDKTENNKIFYLGKAKNIF